MLGGVVQARADTTGEVKGASDADRAQGIEFVRVEHDLGLDRRRFLSVSRPKPVGADAMNDAVNEVLIADADVSQDIL